MLKKNNTINDNIYYIIYIYKNVKIALFKYFIYTKIIYIYMLEYIECLVKNLLKQ